jgi:hypothetical protein
MLWIEGYDGILGEQISPADIYVMEANIRSESRPVEELVKGASEEQLTWIQIESRLDPRLAQSAVPNLLTLQ